MRLDEKNKAKKTYSRPELHVYGNIQAQTKTIGMNSKNDGMNNKSF